MLICVLLQDNLGNTWRADLFADASIGLLGAVFIFLDSLKSMGFTLSYFGNPPFRGAWRFWALQLGQNGKDILC